MTEKRTRDLWNDVQQPSLYDDSGQKTEHIIEQYKIFVEMADRVSQRRITSNTFFLTLNTLIMTAFAIAYDRGVTLTNSVTLIIPAIAVIVLCVIWARVIRSYHQLNSVKYRIIAEYERQLPSRPYDYEWQLLQEDRYKTFTGLEERIPYLFAILYFVGTIAIIVSVGIPS